MRAHRLKIISYIIIAIILMLVGFYTTNAISKLSNEGSGMRVDSIEYTLNRTVIECFALEGIYPPNLQYLEEGYGIILNYDIYEYFYEFNGANLRPRIEVVRK